MKRLNPFSAFLLIVLFLLSACGTGGGYGGRNAQRAPNTLGQEQTGPSLPGPEQAATSPMRPVKVGILLPLSGEHRPLGESMLKAAQMALFDVGLEGFELIPRDTKTTPADAAAAAQSAIADGAQLLLGPVFAESVAAVRPVAKSADINVIAFTTDWKQAGGNIYTVGFLPFDQINRVIQYSALQGVRRTGALIPTTDYGQIAETAYHNAAARAGIQTTGFERFNPQSREIAATLRKFAQQQTTPGASTMTSGRSLPYDSVFLPVGGDKVRTIASMLTQLGLDPRAVRRIGTGLLDDSALTHEPGLEGAWFAAPSPNARAAFERRFQSAYGMPAPRLSTLAYDATALAAVLARQNGVSNQDPFNRSALMNPNGFAGIDGIFRFRPDGTAERGLAVLEIRRGRIEIIDEAPKTFERPPTTQ